METEGALRVWWIPQVPGKPFRVKVNSPEEALRVMDMLARYDNFQFKNRIKPDYCNVGGLEVFEDGEWCEWYHRDTGDDIKEYKESSGIDAPTGDWEE